MAVGTRTAPDFALAASGRKVTLHFFDVSEDYYSQVILNLPTAATDAQVEAIAAAFQAASQASLWKITDNFVYAGVAKESNAGNGLRSSSGDGINMLYKNGIAGMTLRIPAPLEATMIGDSDNVDTTSTELLAVNTAVEAAVTGFVAESALFTGRRDRNNTRQSF